MRRFFIWFGLIGLVGLTFARNENDPLYFVRVKVATVDGRTALSHAGIAIDQVFSDSITFHGTKSDIDRVKALGMVAETMVMPARARAFPSSDAPFHDFAEVTTALDALVAQYPDIVSRFSMGKSLEGRDLAGVRISADPAKDSLPTAVYLGCHHAREHLSVEVPLKLAQYLASEYHANNERVKKLLSTREVWIAPMVNPDGAEYDISSRYYKMWRKNRRNNGDGSYGVDLNRNYGGSGWGGEGSSSMTTSDTYRGTAAFSEPETQAVRDFLRTRKLASVLITFHTFSELVLWPWGHTYDQISDTKDRSVFETLGNKMATWNHYKAMKSSGLYLASGDTTDWAYEELKTFAFTIELSPTSLFEGGFYPGAGAIEPTFKANLEPALYLLENAGKGNYWPLSCISLVSSPGCVYTPGLHVERAGRVDS